MNEIVSEYRAIIRSHKESHCAQWQSLEQNPQLDKDQKRDRWFEICDSLRRQKIEAFSTFSNEESDLLYQHAFKLFKQAYSLCLTIQEECPKLQDDGTVYEDDLIDLLQWHEVQYRATERLNRRYDLVGNIHDLIEEVKMVLEQAQSEFVN